MPTFAELWKNHPVISGNTPVLDKKVYQNQCAINMSVSLINCGVNMDSFSGARSWEKDKPKYAIRAEELAAWLDRNAVLLPGKVRKFTGRDVETAFDRIKGGTGVIFFKDYYGPGQSGDHIDLYNKVRLTEMTSWFRVSFGISWEGVWSDFRKSKAIWYWEMK